MVKMNEVVLILVLYIFLTVIERSGNKINDVCLLFLNHKILTRLNIIILEIFTEESNLENENILILIEKILDLIIKFTEIESYRSICDDNIFKTLINLCYNIPLVYIAKFLKIFENLLRDPSSINVLIFIKV